MDGIFMESANTNEKIKIVGKKTKTNNPNPWKSELPGILLDWESSGDGVHHLVPGSQGVVMDEMLREVGIIPIFPHPPWLRDPRERSWEGSLPPFHCQQGAQENPRLPSAGMRGWKGIRALPRDRRQNPGERGRERGKERKVGRGKQGNIN